MERRFSLQDFGIGILTGLAIGAVAGILLAPESGESTRVRLLSGAENLRTSAEDLINNARDSINRAVDMKAGVFGSRETQVRKRLEALKEELEKYNLSGA